MEVEVLPSAEDLLCIIGVLSQENDFLRERIGQCGIRFTRRMFTHEDLERGAELGPSACVLGSGSIVIHLES